MLFKIYNCCDSFEQVLSHEATYAKQFTSWRIKVVTWTLHVGQITLTGFRPNKTTCLTVMSEAEVGW